MAWPSFMQALGIFSLVYPLVYLIRRVILVVQSRPAAATLLLYLNIGQECGTRGFLPLLPSPNACRDLDQGIEESGGVAEPHKRDCYCGHRT